MHTEDMDKPENVRRPRRARGGKTSTPVNVYNAKGSPEMSEAEDQTEDFKRGGHKKRMFGGMAEGSAAEERADRAPRGRRKDGGRNSPYSSGSSLSMKKGSGASLGHEGQDVPEEPHP